MDVFLLCGQSNMAGRGGVAERAWDGIVPPPCSPPATPTVWSLRPDGQAWVRAAEPLFAGAEPPGKTCGIGPGLAFASALLRAQPGRHAVGLVPCAVGGSALREWELETDGELGLRCVARAHAARAVPCADAPPRLAGVVFYQGETDAMCEADAGAWGARFARLAAALRAELRAPALPFLVVAITALQSACPHLQAVREAQLALPAAVTNCAVIDAAGLPLQSDGLHLTAAAAAALGEQLAVAWLAHEAAWLAL